MQQVPFLLAGTEQAGPRVCTAMASEAAHKHPQHSVGATGPLVFTISGEPARAYAPAPELIPAWWLRCPWDCL